MFVFGKITMTVFCSKIRSEICGKTFIPVGKSSEKNRESYYFRIAAHLPQQTEPSGKYGRNYLWYRDPIPRVCLSLSAAVLAAGGFLLQTEKEN